MSQAPHAVLASKADGLVDASSNKLMHGVSGPYENITVRDSTLAIL